jgi:uncharacterized protein (DUF3820 family)
MEAIASRNEIALQLNLFMLVDKSYARLTRRDIKQLDILDGEKDVSPLGEVCGNQVLQDFMLWVERDGTPVGQFGERNAMTLSIKAEFDPMMHSSFTPHAFSKTHFRQQIDRPLLEHTRANRRFYGFSAPAFEHNRINSLPGQEQRE